MKNLFVRIEDNIYDQLDEFITREKLSKKEAIEKAISLLLNNQNKNIDYEKLDIKQVSLKQIITKYRGKCSKCGRTIEIGEIAYWSQGILICYDCYVKANEKIVSNAKKELEHYKKLKRLKILINEAEKQLDLLVKKINIYESFDFLTNISKELKNRLNEIGSYLYDVERDNKELKQILEELVKINDKIDEFLGMIRITKEKVMAYR